MDKKLIRKLLAGLLACAMLLASVAAFADDADPAVEPTTAPEEQIEETETTETVTDDTTTDGTDPADPADDEEVDAEDNEDEDAEGKVDDEGKPVAPPINFGAAPNVEGAEDKGDSANAENGIAPLFFHKHDHKYADLKESDWERKPERTIYEQVDGNNHTRSDCYEAVLRCTGCTDDQVLTRFTAPINEPHYDANEDQICDACGDTYNGGNTTEEAQGPQNHDHDVDNWEVIKQGTNYYPITSNLGLYDTKTDKFDTTKKTAGQNDATGHIRVVWSKSGGVCKTCTEKAGGEGHEVYVTKEEREEIIEAHKFVNGKCACGYKQPVAAKKEEDTRVRMGVKLMKEIRKLTADGVTVNLRDEQLVYTEQEFAAVQTVSDPFERMLMMLAALGYGDEVKYAIKNQGLDVSDAALDLIEQLGERDALPGTAEVFLSTEKVNGKEREVVTISMVLSGNGVATESYTFYKDGSNFYFFD